MDRTQNARALARTFRDPEYRRGWADDYLDTYIAMQIAALRLARGWNQSILADRAGTTQSAISRMEDVEYGAHSVRMLKQLAAAFDLRLRVSFEEFGTLIEESEAFSDEALNRHSFDNDPRVCTLLELPVPSLAEEVESTDDGIAGPPAYPLFEEDVQSVLARPLEDRIRELRRWLMGYGIPAEDEPAYHALYYSIPPDEQHTENARRLAEACAEFLNPEGIGEFLADPDDGERALLNVFRLSGMLMAGRTIVIVALGPTIPWLAQEWEAFPGLIRDAVVDLTIALDDVDLAERLLRYGGTKLDDRRKLRLSIAFYDRAPDNRTLLVSLADSFDAEAIRNVNDPVVQRTACAVAELEPSQFRNVEFQVDREYMAATTMYLNKERRRVEAQAAG